MRLVVIIVIALVVFLGIGIYSEIWLSNTAQEISVEVAKLEQTIKNKKWDEAAELIKTIHKNWSSIEERWDIIVDHREMDEIDLALTRAMKFIEAESFDLALAEVAVIQHMVLHIAKKESLRILNIF
ncbi:DUF4363 family protein [Desulfitibacter alkalitolerans]|uniref:DUF4363 family protein n=1 Tax=Desulfitibacter alkalitolerans TaxID=264641 RepID=UPI00048300DD|nr:DUF4363 family protein [Desulfitibacter alkalitolerans]